MDKQNYRELVQKIIKNHVGNSLNTNTEVQLIFDTERDRYQLLHIGWQDLHRVFGCIIYIEIKNNKIWIERDGTEIGVANELLEAGVPKEDIVLAFHAPYKRKYTEFAVGYSGRCDRTLSITFWKSDMPPARVHASAPRERSHKPRWKIFH